MRSCQNHRMKQTLIALSLPLIALIAGCASGPGRSDIPYPAFVQTDDLEDTFLAALPGVRAKPYTSDIRTGTLSGRVDMPADWTGTTGGAPGKSVEIFVLAGTLWLGEFKLGPTGYAYVPPGSLGFRLRSDTGARILYFLDEPDSRAFIRSPIIIERSYDWQHASDGIDVIMLRMDTGNNSRTWLRRARAGANERWESSAATREGYLVSGEYTSSECVLGKPVTGTYEQGGYFRRPAGALSGGPAAQAVDEAVWFFREGRDAEVTYHDVCSLTD